MMKDLVKHVANDTGLSNNKTKVALGIVLNATDRQGAPIAELIFTKVPGARTMAARSGATTGAATGLIARMIERTPGGRSEVAFQMIRDLQCAGLGHTEISALLPSVAGFAKANLGFASEGHLGDFLCACEASCSFLLRADRWIFMMANRPIF